MRTSFLLEKSLRRSFRMPWRRMNNRKLIKRIKPRLSSRFSQLSTLTCCSSRIRYQSQICLIPTSMTRSLKPRKTQIKTRAHRVHSRMIRLLKILTTLSPGPITNVRAFWLQAYKTQVPRERGASLEQMRRSQNRRTLKCKTPSLARKSWSCPKTTRWTTTSNRFSWKRSVGPWETNLPWTKTPNFKN